jgi:choline dehydrogenase-like flavoprotein
MTHYDVIIIGTGAGGYVADTSIFPSIGAVNPALTAMANALRVGDQLLERMGVGTDATRPTLSPV